MRTSLMTVMGISVVSLVLGGAGVCRAGDSVDAATAMALKQGPATAQNGLCLYLGASESRSLAQLAAGCHLQVQGVVSDRDRVERLRSELQTDVNANRLSVLWRRTTHLPYLDNLVNLVIVPRWGKGEDTKGLALSEVVRVLAPGGVALVGCATGSEAAALVAEAGKINLAQAESIVDAEGWIRIVKKMNPAFGEWTQYGGGAGQTMVSTDTVVEPSKEVRWINRPLWANGGYRNDVLAGGRNFYEENEWIGGTLRQWVIVARDAFNGCELWREKTSIDGAAHFKAPDRSLCADDKRVYYVDGTNLVARDASTGKLLMTYGAAAGTVTSSGDWLITRKAAIHKETGKVVAYSDATLRCFPVAVDGVVYFLKGNSGNAVEAFQLSAGKSLWKRELVESVSDAGKVDVRFMARGNNLYVVKSSSVIAINREDGNVRWSYVMTNAINAYGWVPFPLANEVLLCGKVKAGKGSLIVQVLLDAATGKELKTFRATSRIDARCWDWRATDRFFVPGDQLYIDHQSSAFLGRLTGGIRPSCGIGKTLGYGMEYMGPHACSCEVSLRGAVAAAGTSHVPKGDVSPRLITGERIAAGMGEGTNDWPIYRANVQRSDAYAGALPPVLKQLWSVKLGKTKLPQITGVGGTLFVADPENHRVVALAADTGRQQWSFPTEGRVSVAPTYYKGVCLFGDHAGWVYCLNAATGKLVWQLQAAPEQKIMSAFNRFESSWPVKSGVLVFKDRAFFIAGRCGFMDGGLTFYSVEPLTGKVLFSANYNDTRPTDLLVSDGRVVMLPVSRNVPQSIFYDPEPTVDTNQPTPPSLTRLRADGGLYYQHSILDILDSLDPVQTTGRKRVLNGGKLDGDLIAFDGKRGVATLRNNGFFGGRNKEPSPGDGAVEKLVYKGATSWTKNDTGQQMQALVLAGERVYGASIPLKREGDAKPVLWVLSAVDGSVVQKLPLAGVPSIDGLSAVGGRLLLATVDGQVMCFGAP